MQDLTPILLMGAEVYHKIQHACAPNTARLPPGNRAVSFQAA